MKYLKYFESDKWDPHQDLEIKTHLETINDLFIDVVDEFDLYSGSAIDPTPNQNLYDIFHWEYYSIIIRGESKPKNLSEKIRLIIKDSADKKEKILLSKSFLGFLSRLKSLGYEVFQMKQGLDFIYDIDYSNLIKYNESKKEDLDFHVQHIHDIFLDVVDELGLDRYIDSSFNGFFYNVQPFAPFVRVWVANIQDHGGEIPYTSLSDDIKNSQVLKDFESRLRNMGYTFERENGGGYYDIRIYI